MKRQKRIRMRSELQKKLPAVGSSMLRIILRLPFLLSLFSRRSIAWYRQTILPQNERLGVSFGFRFPFWGRQGIVDKVLSLVLVVAMLGAIGALGYTIAKPPMKEKFTEFYILGLEGKAEGYPREFVMEQGKVVRVKYEGEEGFQPGEYGKVILGIVNREQEEASYQVEVRINGERVKMWLDGGEVQEIGPFELARGEKWEHEVGFAPQEVCGSTILSTPATKGQKEIVVAQIENFGANDYIQIGATGEATTEFVQIEHVDINQSTITLKTELKHDHSEGDTVIENQEVEFLLYKDGGPYFEEGKSPHLWIDVTQAP